MKQQIKSRFDDRVLYECEADSLLEALQAAVKAGANLTRANLYEANLTRANLDEANLTRANLYGANLYGANLTRANLDGANLDGANLYGANLDGANLDGANLDGANLYGKLILDIIQVSGIGSAHRTTAAIILADAVQITCGCFRGTIDEWKAKIESTHADNPKYLAQYRAAVAFVEACVTTAREKGD